MELVGVFFLLVLSRESFEGGENEPEGIPSQETTSDGFCRNHSLIAF